MQLARDDLTVVMTMATGMSVADGAKLTCDLSYTITASVGKIKHAFPRKNKRGMGIDFMGLNLAVWIEIVLPS